MQSAGPGNSGCGCFSVMVGIAAVVLCLMVIVWGLVFMPLTSGQSDNFLANRLEGNRIAREVVYFYDERTGLCFARNGTVGSGITMVPYKKVKDVLLNPPEKPPE